MAAFSKMNSVGTGSGQYLFIGNWMGISEGVDGRCRFAGVGTRHVMLGKKGSSTDCSARTSGEMMNTMMAEANELKRYRIS